MKNNIKNISIESFMFSKGGLHASSIVEDINKWKKEMKEDDACFVIIDEFTFETTNYIEMLIWYGYSNV